MHGLAGKSLMKRITVTTSFAMLCIGFTTIAIAEDALEANNAEPKFGEAQKSPESYQMPPGDHSTPIPPNLIGKEMPAPGIPMGYGDTCNPVFYILLTYC